MSTKGRAYGPPSFLDLGDKCKKLLTKGYLDGWWRLDVRSGTAPGVQFSTSGMATADGKTLGFVETKFKLPDTNLHLTNRWHNVQGYIVEGLLRDQFTEGLSLKLKGRYLPAEDEKSGAFELNFEQPVLKFDMDSTLTSNPILNLSGVLRYKHLLGGYHTTLDTSNMEFKTHDYALGYQCSDWQLHMVMKENLKDINGRLYLHCTDKFDVGVEANFKEGEESSTKAILGARYEITKDINLVRAKLDNDYNLSMGYQHTLRKGATLILSCLLQCKDFSNGDHKAGIGLEIDHKLFE